LPERADEKLSANFPKTGTRCIRRSGSMDPRCASSLSPRAKEAFRGFYRYSAFQFPGSIADYEIDTSFEQANPPIAVRAIADPRSKEPSIFARAREAANLSRRI